MLISPSWLLSHALRSIIVLIPLTLTIIYLFSISKHHHHENLSPIASTPKTLFQSATSHKKYQFVSELIENDFKPRFDGTALAALCESKTWIEGLIVKCEPAEGGIGNVRNIFLNCIRYAIEAGASSLIIPTMIPPQRSASMKVTVLPFSHLFSLDHFTNHLSTACPQMTLIPSINDLWDKPSTSPPIAISPENISPKPTHPKPHKQFDALISSPSTWNTDFHSRLASVHPTPYSANEPILVSFKPPLLLQWPLSFDPPEFVENFSLLLKFKSEILNLAASILYAIDQTHKLRLDPSYASRSDGKSKFSIQKNTYYTAHLRTALDAVAAGWTSYDIQSSNYLSAALAAEAPLIYLINEDRSDTRAFVKFARQRGIEVTNARQALSADGVKKDLEKERKIWQAMRWEERNCVDWIIAGRGSGFGGTWESSFAWGVAMGRKRAEGVEKWGVDYGDGVVDQKRGVKERRWKRDVFLDDVDEKPPKSKDEKAKSPADTKHPPKPVNGASNRDPYPPHKNNKADTAKAVEKPKKQKPVSDPKSEDKSSDEEVHIVEVTPPSKGPAGKTKAPEDDKKDGKAVKHNKGSKDDVPEKEDGFEDSNYSAESEESDEAVAKVDDADDEKDKKGGKKGNKGKDGEGEKTSKDGGKGDVKGDDKKTKAKGGDEIQEEAEKGETEEVKGKGKGEKQKEKGSKNDAQETKVKGGEKNEGKDPKDKGKTGEKDGGKDAEISEEKDDIKNGGNSKSGKPADKEPNEDSATKDNKDGDVEETKDGSKPDQKGKTKPNQKVEVDHDNNDDQKEEEAAKSSDEQVEPQPEDTTSDQKDESKPEEEQKEETAKPDNDDHHNKDEGKEKEKEKDKDKPKDENFSGGSSDGSASSGSENPQSYSDIFSTVFGPVDEGEMFLAAMWP